MGDMSEVGGKIFIYKHVMLYAVETPLENLQ
jgi:hypothetical protein